MEFLMQADINELKAEMAKLKTRVAYLEGEVHRLTGQMPPLDVVGIPMPNTGPYVAPVVPYIDGQPCYPPIGIGYPPIAVGSFKIDGNTSLLAFNNDPAPHAAKGPGITHTFYANTVGVAGYPRANNEFGQVPNEFGAIRC